MKKIFNSITVFLILCIHSISFNADAQQYEAYLITCGPGTETYSIYGHSALRLINKSTGEDMAFNWGVFDFSTPNFAWKFAKGRLDYMLAAYPFDRFLNDYVHEKRWVISQKINLEPDEMAIMVSLLNENLRPENISYRYDFFYDDCSTRIRDLLENSIGKELVYPPENPRNNLTFRAKVSEYQRHYPWLNMGIDLIMGTKADIKAGFRDVMFLPLELQEGLSEVVINRSGRMIPLLSNPESIVNFPDPELDTNIFLSPVTIFALLFIVVIIISATRLPVKLVWIFDLFLFAVFSVLALLVLFFSFFTDHEQMKMNLNILWLSPFIIMCFASLITKRQGIIWYRVAFYLNILFLAIFLVFPGGFNNAFLPVVLIIAIRCSVRSDFSWNPLKAGSI